ncbi:MAG: pppA [Planctomycetaceae bacterium]|nr:pppA [Planctomycetaceae bacterium]
MSLIELPLAVMLPFLFVLGAVVGSFLNVAIYRIPQHERFWKQLLSVVHPPSSCPNCGNRILSRDNIPILGWFLLGGRCRFCRQSFSIRYPMIELLNACLFVLVYWMEIPSNVYSGIEESCLYVPSGPHGFAGSIWLSPTAVMLWRYVYHMILIEALVVATFIDFDLRIIPDGVTLPAMCVGVVGGVVFGQVHLVPVWFQRGDLSNFVSLLYDIRGGDMPPAWLKSLASLWWMSGSGIPSWCSQYPHLHGLAVSLAGLVIGGGVVWVVRYIGQSVLRQEAMGFGDVVLMAMVGSFLGWQPTVLVFVLAPLMALLAVAGTWLFARQREIPYGPYLSMAALVVIVGWKWIWDMFERVFELGPLLPFLAVGMAIGLYLLLHVTQFIKWCLGIELYPPPEWTEEWTSADQLIYLSMEQTDPQQGQWRQSQWPGSQAGAGQIHANNWRRPAEQIRSNGWQQHWQRRGS